MQNDEDFVGVILLYHADDYIHETAEEKSEKKAGKY
jgi:hypothetical protein